MNMLIAVEHLPMLRITRCVCAGARGYAILHGSLSICILTAKRNEARAPFCHCRKSKLPRLRQIEHVSATRQLAEMRVSEF